MSNFRSKAFNPASKRVEVAEYCDDYYGRHRYGIRFDDGCVHPEAQCGIDAAATQLDSLLKERDALQARVKELEAERDDALDRVEELEQNAEVVSDEFEKDCWKAMRSLLSECKFDWRNVEPDGVTADDAREYIHDTLSDLESRATRLQQERDEAYERLKPLSEVVLPWGNVGSGMVSADAVLAARDLVRRLAGPEKIAAANDGEDPPPAGTGG